MLLVPRRRIYRAIVCTEKLVVCEHTGETQGTMLGNELSSSALCSEADIGGRLDTSAFSCGLCDIGWQENAGALDK